MKISQRSQWDVVPATFISNLLIITPYWLPFFLLFPQPLTSAFWDHLLNKLLAIQYLTQGQLLGELRLRY